MVSPMVTMMVSCALATEAERRARRSRRAALLVLFFDVEVFMGDIFKLLVVQLFS